jgi:hypothetical protein
VQLGSATKLAQELTKNDVRNRYGKLIDKGYIYKLLSNRLYVGDAVHKGTAYPGEHEAIIDRKLWDAVHAILKESPRKRGARNRAQTPALLKGLIFGPSGAPMTPTHTRKRGRLYRYYASVKLPEDEDNPCPLRRIPASEIETAVIDQIRRMIQTPEIVIATWRTAKQTITGLTERRVRECFENFDSLWAELFPAEQVRIIHLLVSRIDITESGANIVLKVEGLTSLFAGLQPLAEQSEAA